MHFPTQDWHENFIEKQVCNLEKTSETVSYCSLMIPPPKYLMVNRKLLSYESENASDGIADLYKP